MLHIGLHHLRMQRTKSVDSETSNKKYVSRELVVLATTVMIGDKFVP
jgi:hypothetical protein